MAKTEGAAQQNWQVPSEFPCCPNEAEEEPIKAYAKKLKVGSIFATNDYSETEVFKVATIDDGQSLLVMCLQKKSGVKPWSLAKVFYEDGLYIHTSLGTFFDDQGAEKSFTIKQGLEWAGGDSIDDYC